MAILDERTEIADAVSVAAAAGTANIGDVIDTGSVVRNLASGQPVYLVLTVDTSIITGGSAGTIQFRLVSDAITTPDTSTASVHWTSKAFVTDDDALNDLDAGEVIAVVALPDGIQVPYERYLGIQAIVATTTVTAGAISAFLTLDPSVGQNKAYPDASN